MVKTIFEDIKNSIKGIEINEVSYAERGYHLAVEATKGNLLNIIGLLDKKRFYIADMCCVDYVEYLEIVYLFNNHSSLCRIKVSLKVDPERPVAPTISHIYTMAHWYEREIYEFFGVYFEGHDKLIYLFLHDGIDFYPLRKQRVPVSAEDMKLLNSFKPREEEDTFFVNLGPQHPSTHGVLRVVIKMDGEYVVSAEPVLGYLHRMHEKMAENRTYQ
ncbi:MAG TPA: NADH-quinone oxidoreductase subunit C, partial [Syntrophorhabdaceae bacterium]|nr:NADH-quinone oxidoreductase subunit C [Syntrophorhabdaceae bacterium]